MGRDGVVELWPCPENWATQPIFHPRQLTAIFAGYVFNAPGGHKVPAQDLAALAN